jgi:hypothetical protein
MRNRKVREHPEASTGAGRVQDREKRPYRKPVLGTFGRIAELTHGPSLGNSESGNPTFFKL